MNRVPVEFEHLFQTDAESVAAPVLAPTNGSAWAWAQHLDKHAPAGRQPVPDPVGALFSKAERASNGVTDVCIDDLNEPSTAAPPSLSKRSEDRFEKACSEIRRIFSGHDEACAEMIELAKQMLTHARAEAIAKAAA